VIKLGHTTIKCIASPCHTRGHFLFLASNPSSASTHLFTGDTLFSGGCGRFFEGTASQMRQALYEVIGRLPHETLVWCGHEYTLGNLQFALTVESGNEALKSKFASVRLKRQRAEPTVPSTIGEEFTFNPFMRVENKAIKASVGNTEDSDDETMGKLRERKNSFKTPLL